VGRRRFPSLSRMSHRTTWPCRMIRRKRLLGACSDVERLLGTNSSEIGYTIMEVLVVELDYFPDLEVFYFQPCLYPIKYLHPKSMYTIPCGGVQRGCTPSAGSGGAIPPTEGSGSKRAPSRGSGAKPLKQKLPCKSIL
jgi:hypothetical protein